MQASSWPCNWYLLWIPVTRRFIDPAAIAGTASQKSGKGKMASEKGPARGRKAQKQEAVEEDSDIEMEVNNSGPYIQILCLFQSLLKHNPNHVTGKANSFLWQCMTH